MKRASETYSSTASARRNNHAASIAHAWASRWACSSSPIRYFDAQIRTNLRTIHARQGQVPWLHGKTVNLDTFGAQDHLCWDTSSMTNMYQAFFYEANFNGVVTSWDTSRVTNMPRLRRPIRFFVWIYRASWIVDPG